MILGKGRHFITTLCHAYSGVQANTFLQLLSTQSPAYHKPSMQNITLFDHLKHEFYLNKISYQFGKQKPCPIDNKILNSAFIANFILYKIDNFQKKVTYQSIKTSLRQQIVASLKKLKLEKGKINGSYYIKYLDAYQIGRGVELQELNLQKPHSRIQTQLLENKFVFNPTSITRKILQEFTNLNLMIVGNKGIGKSLNFRQLKFLSEARIHHYLQQGSSIQDLSQLVHQNLDAFYQNKIKDAEILILQKFKKYPLYIYYQTNLNESWEKLFEKMKIQFSYFSFFEEQMKKVENKILSEDQYKQLCQKFFEYLNEKLIQIKDKHNKTIVVVDQLNEYYKNVAEYYEEVYDAIRIRKLQDYRQKQKFIKQILLDQKDTASILQKKLLIMKQKLNLFDKLDVQLKYVFTSKAQFDFFSPLKKDRNLIIGDIFFQIAQNKAISNKQQLHYGINLADQIGQIQMYTIFCFLLKQKLFKILYTKMSQTQCRKRIKSLKIQEILDKVYNGQIINKQVKSRVIARFQSNTTQLICSDGLRQNDNQILISQVVQLINSNHDLKQKSEQKQPTNKKSKNFQAIQEKLSDYVVDRLTYIAQLSQKQRLQQFYKDQKEPETANNALFSNDKNKDLQSEHVFYHQQGKYRGIFEASQMKGRFNGSLTLKMQNLSQSFNLEQYKSKIKHGQNFKITKQKFQEHISKKQKQVSKQVIQALKTQSLHLQIQGQIMQAQFYGDLTFNGEFVGEFLGKYIENTDDSQKQLSKIRDKELFE